MRFTYQCASALLISTLPSNTNDGQRNRSDDQRLISFVARFKDNTSRVSFLRLQVSVQIEKSSFKAGAVPVIMLNGSTIVDIMIENQFDAFDHNSIASFQDSLS